MGQNYVLPTARSGFVIISRSVPRRSVGPARLEVQGGLLGFFWGGYNPALMAYLLEKLLGMLIPFVSSKNGD